MSIPKNPQRLWFRSDRLQVSLWPLVKDVGSFGFLVSGETQAFSCKISKDSKRLRNFFLDLEVAKREIALRDCELKDLGQLEILEINGKGPDGAIEAERIQTFLCKGNRIVNRQGEDARRHKCPRLVWKIASNIDYDFLSSLCEDPLKLKREETDFKPVANWVGRVGNFHFGGFRGSNWYYEIQGESSRTSFLVHSFPVNFDFMSFEKLSGYKVRWVGVQEDDLGNLKQVQSQTIAGWNASWELSLNQATRSVLRGKGVIKGAKLGELNFRGGSTDIGSERGDQVHLVFFEGSGGLAWVEEQAIDYVYLEDRMQRVFFPQIFEYLVPSLKLSLY
jgi:hypothetical protein